MTIKEVVKKTVFYSLYKKISILRRPMLNIDQMKKSVNHQYKSQFNMNINWNNPKKYTEMLCISKLLCANEVKTKLTDKVKVRDWVKDKIGEKYLIPLLGVYNSYEEIDFSKLPKQFVIKCSHDSGSVTVIEDKNTINHKELKKKYKKLLKRNFAYVGFEMHYKEIEPKIIIEKHMGNPINDYKFLCFNGKVYYCWVDIDRFSDHRRNIYDLDWNLQDFTQDYKNYKGKVEKPQNFEKMVEIASILCKSFDHVRVDLYNINGRIYFGEMTFTSGNGLEPITPEEYDEHLGSLWGLKLPEKQ